MLGQRQALLQTACAALQAAGARAALVAADLADRSARAAVAQASAAAFGAPDIVVHAAGMNRRQPWPQIDDKAWDEQLDVMLAAPFFLSRALQPAMVCISSPVRSRKPVLMKATRLAAAQATENRKFVLAPIEISHEGGNLVSRPLIQLRPGQWPQQPEETINGA